jgi:CRISPR-associated protein Cmr1
MRKVEIELMTVTPLFLGGSDPRGQPPELRPPSFRGAMRYWYRAALGGVVGDADHNAVRKVETAVFGSTEQGSPVSLRLRGQLQYDQYAILPHKNAGRRSAFNPGQKFILTMTAGPACSEIVWMNACMALNLALTLGGVGLRSRRGMGGLQVVSSTQPDLVPTFPEQVNLVSRFIKLITRSAIQQVKTLAAELKVPTGDLPQSPTEFPCAALGAEFRLVRQINARQPVEAVAELMKRFPKVAWLGGITPRQSSPVWARVLKTREGYHLLFTVLPSKMAQSTHNYSELRKWLDNTIVGDLIEVKGWTKNEA